MSNQMIYNECTNGNFYLAKCIDAYTAARKKKRSKNGVEGQDVIDPRLESIVESVFRSCFDNKEYKQVSSGIRSIYFVNLIIYF